MKITMLSICCAAVAAAASAQQGRGIIARTVGDQTVEFIAGEPNLGPVVRGAPYSGAATTTVTQTLADGTRIERVTSARVFRDSEGRMRREQTVQGLGPLNGSGETIVITIVDPVAGVSYALDPVSKKARRLETRQNVMTAKVEALSAEQRQLEERRRAERIAGAGEPARAPQPPPGGVMDPLAPPPPPPPPPGGGVAIARARGRSNEPIPNAPQPLGSRQIEGVETNGVKRLEVIPVGRIGNDRPIEIVDERWESPALKVLVLSRHSDPRTGVVEYRLTDILRSEPPHDLFVVPSDYTIVEARNDERR